MGTVVALAGSSLGIDVLATHTVMRNYMRAVTFFSFLVPGLALCDESAIQRAVIERDQQSAEFAREGLENLHARQLLEASQPLPANLRPYQRERMKQERERAGAEKAVIPPAPDYRPSPLPGRPRPLVDPIPAPSVGG